MLGHELAMALRGAYLAMHRRSDALLATVGVTADQFVVLATLADEDRVRQQDIVERTHSDPSTIRAMLVLMEKKGLVTRGKHPDDRRARCVKLTRAGMEMYRRAWDITQVIRDEMTEGLGGIGTEVMVDLLVGIKEAAEEAGQESEVDK